MLKAVIVAFIAIYIGFCCLMQDADFITYFFDIYRRQFITNCFEGKNVWIIGASSGIGECLTYDIIKNGASKVIISARRENELNRVQSNVKQITQKEKQEIYVKPLDIKDFLDENYAKLFISELYLQHPDIDIVVLNVGLAQQSKVTETSLKTTSKLFDINLFGFISIINSILNNGINLNNTNKQYQFAITSSISAITGEPYGASFAAAKAAMAGYFNSVQLELIRYNIDFTIVYPGFIKIDENKANSYVGGDGKDIDFKYSLGDNYNENEVMACSRCAQLYSTAIYNKLRVSWISNQPILAFAYVYQYFSFVIKLLQKIVGVTYL
eukprot:108937_1